MLLDCMLDKSVFEFSKARGGLDEDAARGMDIFWNHPIFC